MLYLTAVLNCVDGRGLFEISNISKQITELRSNKTQNIKKVVELLAFHGVNLVMVREQIPSYFYIHVNVLAELVSFFTPNTPAVRALLLSRWWRRIDLNIIDLSTFPDFVNQVGTERAKVLANEVSFYLLPNSFTLISHTMPCSSGQHDWL